MVTTKEAQAVSTVSDQRRAPQTWENGYPASTFDALADIFDRGGYDEEAAE